MDSDILDGIKAWPMIEARKLLDKIGHVTPEKGYVLFQTGYGPSGLPHIGTFGEVARTTMVINAFKFLAPDIPVKLFAFSDDLDGLRKVPENLPNQKIIEANLGKPLTEIPDPFGEAESFGDGMNLRLCKFLDSFEFDYEFKSATKCYREGVFNEALLKILANYEKVRNVILPTLGDERRANYSPFMPISKISGKVLQTEITGVNVEKAEISYLEEDGTEHVTKVTDGNCKLQWKPDWGMRWAAFDVDFEMHGKDLTPSAVLSSQISKIISGKAPQNFVYELFLDEEGKKISKSKGNGVTIDRWLEYAPPESLALFNYSNPQKAKKLYLEIIPKQMDEYLTHLKKFSECNEIQKLSNPIFYICGKKLRNGEKLNQETHGLTFSLLLNLAAVCNPENKDVLWGYIKNYEPNANAEQSPIIDLMAQYAVKYYDDFIKPNKQYRAPKENELTYLQEIIDILSTIDSACNAEEIQSKIYEIGMKYEPDNLRGFFGAIYEILLGQKQGPRLGSFIKLYGFEPMINLIKKRIS